MPTCSKGLNAVWLRAPTLVAPPATRRNWAKRTQVRQYRESGSAIAHPYHALARKCRSSYHVEVAETGGDRDSSDIGDRTQRPVGGSRPRRASQHDNADPDHSSASRG